MAEGTIVLPVDSTGKALRTQTGGVNQPASTHQQVGSFAGPDGSLASVFPPGFLRVTDEPSQLFYDPFDTTLDTTNRWTSASAGGGVAAAVASGVLTVGSGTTAAGYSYVQSQPTFVPTIPAWLGASFAISIENPVLANAHRFWGLGTSPASPTVTAPLTNAVGFEIATDGKLYAVVYSGGVRTVVQDFSAATGNAKQPTDANNHRYIVYYRTDRTYFYIDSLAEPAASASFVSPAVQTLPVKVQSVAGTTPTSSAAVTCAGLAIWDTGKNNARLSDPNYPWRQSTMTVIGSKTGLDVNIAGSAGGVATSAQVITAASANVSGTANTTAMCVVPAATLGNCTITINTAAFVGTMQFEASDDNGTTYFSVAAAREDATGQDVAPVFTVSATYARMWIVALAGVTHFRVRCSAFTSGTAAVRLTGGPMLIEPNPIAAAVPVDGNKATFAAYHSGFASALTSGVPVWRLLGSATKVVKLIHLEVVLVVAGTSPTGGSPMILRKGGATTAGTTSAATQAGGFDTNDGAPTAVSVGYTAAGTTSVASSTVVRIQRFTIAAGTFGPYIWDFGAGRPEKAPTIRGTGEEFNLQLAATIGGTTPSATWTILCEWTEENP